MRNGKGGRSSVSRWDLPLFGDFCAHPELPGRDADGAVEVIGELALGREAGAGSELRQGQITFLQPIRVNFISPKKRRHLCIFWMNSTLPLPPGAGSFTVRPPNPGES